MASDTELLKEAVEILNQVPRDRLSCDCGCEPPPVDKILSFLIKIIRRHPTWKLTL